jgi:hypothetical protein
MAIKVYERGAFLYFALWEQDLEDSFLGNFDKTDGFTVNEHFAEFVEDFLRSDDQFQRRLFFRLPTAELSTAGIIQRG